MPILERSVATAGMRTAFASLFMLAMFSATVFSFFITGAAIATAAGPRLRASVGPAYRVHHTARRPSLRVRAPFAAEERAAIVDVAPGISDGDALKLVHLAPGEHVVSVDDCPADRLTGCALLRQRWPRATFHDLEVAGGRGGPRRVVLLLH